MKKNKQLFRQKKEAHFSKKNHEQPSKNNNILYGQHAVKAALLNPKRKKQLLYVVDSLPQWLDQIIKHNQIKSLPHKIIDPAYMRNLLPESAVHQGVALSVEPLPSISLDEILLQKQNEKKRCFVMLDQVTDPHNIGAIMRSCCAFGASGLIVQKKNAPVLNGLIAKIACGATEYLPYIQETNLSRALEQLQEEGFWCIGLDEHTKQTLQNSLKDINHLVLVMGAEGNGLRPLVAKHCDALAKLPTHPPLESLNVSNATAIALYAYSIHS